MESVSMNGLTYNLNNNFQLNYDYRTKEKSST